MKKTIALLVIGCLVFSLCMISAFAETQMPEMIIGDGTLDGKVNAEDALVVLRIAVVKMPHEYIYDMENPTEVTDVVAQLLDVDNSFHIDATDALMILKKGVGKEVTFIRQSVVLPDNAQQLDWSNPRIL